MPWVQPVPPSALKEAVEELGGDVDVWLPPDEEDPQDGQLARALQWVAEEQAATAAPENLVVVAGSLYLVADLYRLLQSL